MTHLENEARITLAKIGRYHLRDLERMPNGGVPNAITASFEPALVQHAEGAGPLDGWSLTDLGREVLRLHRQRSSHGSP